MSAHNPPGTPNNPAAILQQGIEMLQRRNPTEAARCFSVILQKWPKDFNALHLLGVALAQQGRFAEGVDRIQAALKVSPAHVGALANLGAALRDWGRPAEAAAAYDRALAIRPDYVEAFYHRGNALQELRRHDEAVASYDKALAIRPDYVEALFARGAALQNLKRLDEALASYDRTLEFRPDHVEALNNRGVALQELKRLDEALASFDKALALRPNHAEALYNRGAVLQHRGQLEAALACYDKALATKPDYVDALNNRGVALQALKRLVDAVASYDRVLTIRPDYAEASNNRGNALQELKLYEQALASYDRALAIRPDYAEAHYNRGVALQDLKRLDEAVTSYDRALAIRPNYAEALNNRGAAHHALKRLEEAVASFRQALAIRPDYVEALYNCGSAVQEQKRLEEAVSCYEKALAIRPDFDFLFGTWLFARMQICEWRDFAEDVSSLTDRILRGQKASSGFPVVTMTDSPGAQRKAAEIWVSAKAPPDDSLGSIKVSQQHARIRVGYFSADFHSHATAYLMSQLFESHDRSKFELIAFSFGPPSNDEMRQRLAAAFDQFIDVRSRSDRQVAMLARSLEIDIAVDLKGFTTDCRTGIFAARAAPVQVNYLGYPGTMGASYIDYLIADSQLVHKDELEHFSEKVVFLPDSYQVNDSSREISARAFSRAELGLPETGFIFCCFNNNFKITPPIFDIWMQLLRQVSGSVLWLLEDNASASSNLRKEASRRGVSPERLVFAQRMPQAEHLARHRLADLFLDTLPYNAHTTGSDALWAGLPVLTCAGKTFAGRVAASLLNAVGLSELVASDLDEYAALALHLATHPERLNAIRQKLAANRLTSPLFDTALFTSHLESAFMAMDRRLRSGLDPDHIRIDDRGAPADSVA